MDTADEKVERRGSLEMKTAKERLKIEDRYTKARQNAETRYRNAIEKLEKDHRKSLVEAGLNPDGSDPQERPQGSVV